MRDEERDEGGFLNGLMFVLKQVLLLLAYSYLVSLVRMCFFGDSAYGGKWI